MTAQYEYDAVSLFIPSGHEYQSLVFVVGELHPLPAIAESTREKLGKVTAFDDSDNGEYVSVFFENGTIMFNRIPYTRILIGKKNTN